MIDAYTVFSTMIFSLVYWTSFSGALWFVWLGPNLDENDETLGGVCYNVLIRLLLTVVALVGWYYAFTFIFFLFFETLDAL